MSCCVPSIVRTRLRSSQPDDAVGCELDSAKRYVERLSRLAFVAPAIVEAIRQGGQHAAVSVPDEYRLCGGEGGI